MMTPLVDPTGRPIEIKKRSLLDPLKAGWKGVLTISGAIAVVALLLTNIKAIRETATSFTQPGAEVSREVREALTIATSSESVQGRVAGVWRVSPLWSKASDEDLTIIANTLTELLVSPDAQVRATAAEVIGEAYSRDTPEKRRQRLRALLYGSRNDWAVGVVMRRHWGLQGLPGRDAELEATREAIRRNWEDLRDVHMRGASLKGILLYEADLSRAFLREADLSFADLHGANLTDADLEGAKLSWANVSGVIPVQVRLHAVQNGAVEMDTDSWIRWRSAGHPLPPNASAIEGWRANGLRVLSDGTPMWLRSR